MQTLEDEKYKAEDSLQEGVLIASAYLSDVPEMFKRFGTVLQDLGRVTGETISYETSEEAAVAVEKSV